MIDPGLAAIQVLGEKPVFSLDDLIRATGSRATAYRTLANLRAAGFATHAGAGQYICRSSLFQPYSMWGHLAPSLSALRQARYFGRSYNASDVNFARRLLKGTVTLDYRAYELTGFQMPFTLFLYVDDADSASKKLRGNSFWEGTRGRVALLPLAEPIRDELQRVYLDCIAYGGRGILDAIAIEILHGDRLDPKVRGLFRTEDVLKVRDEMLR